MVSEHGKKVLCHQLDDFTPPHPSLTSVQLLLLMTLTTAMKTVVMDWTFWTFVVQLPIEIYDSDHEILVVLHPMSSHGYHILKTMTEKTKSKQQTNLMVMVIELVLDHSPNFAYQHR